MPQDSGEARKWHSAFTGGTKGGRKGQISCVLLHCLLSVFCVFDFLVFLLLYLVSFLFFSFFCVFSLFIGVFFFIIIIFCMFFSFSTLTFAVSLSPSSSFSFPSSCPPFLPFLFSQFLLRHISIFSSFSPSAVSSTTLKHFNKQQTMYLLLTRPLKIKIVMLCCGVKETFILWTVISEGNFWHLFTAITILKVI